jgi:hypothetical protein
MEKQITFEGFSIHTIEIKKQITFLKLREIIKTEFERSNNQYRFYHDEEHKIYISERWKREGIRAFFHENGGGVPPHIRLIINPRILIGDSSYYGIFEKTDKNWKVLFSNFYCIKN